MIRLALLGSGLAVGVAAWLGADDVHAPAAPAAPAVVATIAMTQPGTDVYAGSPGATDDSDAGELSASMIGRCMVVAREVDPALAARLETIRRDRSEDDFRRAMSRARHLVGLARLKDENPQLYGVKVAELKMQAQVDRLMNQLIEARRSSSPSAADLETELQELVRRQVALSLLARGFYLKSLNAHVKSLRDELDHDLANAGPAVQRRYQSLLDRVNAAVNAAE